MKSKKRVTSYDVAQKAGVSRSIVSAVLNGTRGIGVSKETRQAVLSAIKELNYQVDAQAKGMKTGRSNAIAVFGNVSNPLFFQALKGIQATCIQANYHLLLYGGGAGLYTRTGMIDLFLQRRVDGIITADYTNFNDEAWLDLIEQHSIPYISIEGYVTNNRVSSVLMNYRESITNALAYLYDRVQLCPVYLELYDLSDGDSRANWAETNRREAYLDWTTQHGCDPLLLSQEDAPWHASSERWVVWLQKQRFPLAVISNWSRGAVYLYRAASALGVRIGHELFVLAADNTEQVNRHLVPTLSAIEVPYKDMGAVATAHLLDYISGARERTDVEKIWIPGCLVPGESA